MPKIRINEMNGKPATGGVTLCDGLPKLRPGDTVDVPDLDPYRGLLDRGVLVTVAGRPKRVASSAAEPNSDPDVR